MNPAFCSIFTLKLSLHFVMIYFTSEILKYYFLERKLFCEWTSSLPDCDDIAWYIACLVERVYFPFSIFSSRLRVSVLSGWQYGSNIKLGSGLSISRSSKYSYHIRDTAQRPHGGGMEKIKIQTEDWSVPCLLIQKYLIKTQIKELAWNIFAFCLLLFELFMITFMGFKFNS